MKDIDIYELGSIAMKAIDEIDIVEINEAFTCDINGGAIAVGARQYCQRRSSHDDRGGGIETTRW
jgi:hypothetical protein